MEPYRASGALTFRLGERSYDLSRRALVMGILNRTRDSFFAPAATFDLDALLVRAQQLVNEGADVLDVGGVKAGPGDEVNELEEIERIVPAIRELHQRFEIPISIDTWRSAVAEAAFAEGAVLGNDISGFADPHYLSVAARAGASVVATHIRLQPRVADPTPHYDNVTTSVTQFLLERRARALTAGIGAECIVLDAGLDLGKTAAHSVQLLRSSAQLAALGSPLLLSASNKTFLGTMFNLEVTDRREASLAATSLGIVGGCRIIRAHDVAGTVRVRDALSALEEARS